MSYEVFLTNQSPTCPPKRIVDMMTNNQ